MSLFTDMRDCNACSRACNPRFYGYGNGIDPHVLFLLDFPDTKDFTKNPFTAEQGLVISKLLDLMHCPEEKMGVISVVKCRGTYDVRPLISTEHYEACTPFLKRQVELINQKITGLYSFLS